MTQQMTDLCVGRRVEAPVSVVPGNKMNTMGLISFAPYLSSMTLDNPWSYNWDMTPTVKKSESCTGAKQNKWNKFWSHAAAETLPLPWPGFKSQKRASSRATAAQQRRQYSTCGKCHLAAKGPTCPTCPTCIGLKACCGWLLLARRRWINLQWTEGGVVWCGPVVSSRRICKLSRSGLWCPLV